MILGVSVSVSSASAVAEVDECCIRGIEDVFGRAQAESICDPKRRVKPDQLGCSCENNDGNFKFYKSKGGMRRRRDAVCE